MSATKYQLLQELLPYLDRYEQEQGPAAVNLPDFQKWLGERLLQEKETMPASTPAEALDGEIARYLTLLNRYAKFYIKKALHHTEFVSLDDFGYLMHLLDGGPTTKSTLIQKNIQDIPSGTEIIKRLIRQGWVNEARDETDKRKVYLTINDRGKAALFASLGQLRKVSRIVSGNLDLLEKQQLLRILKKLENFHQHQFVPNKDKSIDEFL
ncbi:winged helix-turn-helix transcriptional regulator [Adhaeribacter swui]|uniref:Winged helix-turn-helix transcriptional regulator n=1 Tax=Adhaeribacter swui TaxID=2086471 RepID=A0A7G7GC93_9BACT|nr:MarR family winged helix-turn-helix transcriptional regulator [Adhaeribacter swui]QNF34777.1 winged helix-turn-helix transcriptional regulator [Adhaeribacter swui]